MSKEPRKAFFNGRKDADSRTFDSGVIRIRGVKVAEKIRANMERSLAAMG